MTLKLKDIANITMGQSPKSEFYNPDGKGYPFIQGNRTFNRTYPTIDTWTTSLTKLGKKGTVIMSVRAPVGDLNIAPCDICLGRGVCSLEMKNGNNLFLFYLLKNNVHKFLQKENGTIFGSINKADIENIDIDLPSDEEQAKITAVLKAIDDIINNNDSVETNLKEQLNLLFEKMFIEDSEESWETRKIGDFIDLERGLSYKGNGLSDSDGVPMLNLGNILPNSVFRPEKIKYYTMDYRSRHVVKPGDLIIANTDLTQAREVLGSAIIVPDLGFDTVICSHHISIVRNSTLSKYFLYGLFNRPLYRRRVAGYATGTTVLALPKEAILNCTFKMPPKSKINRFDELSGPMHKMIEHIRKENDSLEKLHGELLRDVFSNLIDLSGVKI